MIKRLASGMLLSIAVSAAHAAPMTITSIVDPADWLLSGANELYVYSHDLIAAGFDPASDAITAATLLIELRDDGGSGDGSEKVAIAIDADDNGSATDAVDALLAASYNPGADYSYSFASFAALTDGKLTVRLTNVDPGSSGNYGDFYFESSTLRVSFDHTPRTSLVPQAAPEPGAALLFAAGFAGLALRRRKTQH